MRAFWKTYVALAALIALGAYIYFVELKRKPDAPEKPRDKVFASLDKAKVKEITLSPAGGPKIRLVRSSEGWRMAEPLTVSAASNEVDSLLGALENLEINEVVLETGADLKEYGLDPAHDSVALTLEGAASPFRLDLGSKTADNASLYARDPSAPRVFTIASYLESTFNKKPFDLRDRDLLHVKRDDVKTLEVRGPEGGFALAKDDKGEWAFTAPLVTLAGRWTVDGLVGSLETLRMESIVAEPAPKDLKPFGLIKPERVVTLGLRDGRQKTLAIGSSAPEDKFYARVDGADLVAVVSKTIVDDLKKGMAEYRAKRLLDLSVYDVTGFESEIEGIKRVYARSTTKDKDGLDINKWKRTAPDAKDLDTNTVQDVLFKIGGVEVGEFIDKPGPPGSYGLDKPILKAAFSLAAPKAPASLEVGLKDGVYYGRRPNDAAILKLDTSKAEDLVKAFKGL